MERFDVAHQIGLVPLAGVLLWSAILHMVGSTRVVPKPAIILAFAFAVSYPADTAHRMIGGTFEHWFFFLPVQLWLIFIVFAKSPLNRIFSAVAVVMLTSISMAWSWPGPDLLVTVVGSIVVVVVVGMAKSWMIVPVYISFGAGSIAYVRMALNEIGTESFLFFWEMYQWCRAASAVAFVAIISAGTIALPLILAVQKWRASR